MAVMDDLFRIGWTEVTRWPSSASWKAVPSNCAACLRNHLISMESLLWSIRSANSLIQRSQDASSVASIHV